MHLNLEALARLVDEPADDAEALHLRDCLVCRRELAALREQTAALASLADPVPAPAAWPALEAALRGEGLVRPQPARRRAGAWTWLRAAAAVLVVVAGGAALLRGGAEPSAPRPVYTPPVALQPAPQAVAGTDTAEPAPAPPGPADPGVVRQVSSAPAPRPAERRAPPPPTPEGRAAARELAEAEAAYVAALRRYAEIADPASGADPQTRLAALETLVESTGRALERAPGDPVLNGYHLAVVDERDALRRQIDRAQGSAWY
jgi:hypothetical protein